MPGLMPGEGEFQEATEPASLNAKQSPGLWTSYGWPSQFFWRSLWFCACNTLGFISMKAQAPESC